MNLKVMIVRAGNGALDFHCNKAVSVQRVDATPTIWLNERYAEDKFFQNIEEGARPVVHALLGNPHSGVNEMFFEPRRFGLQVRIASSALFELILTKLSRGFAPTNMTVLAAQDSLTAADLEALSGHSSQFYVFRLVTREVAERQLLG